MKFEVVLIVTYGRSGSTLLQGVLNTIDNLTIYGENNNFVYNLYKMYGAIQKSINIGNKISKNKKSEDTPKHPWYGYSGINKKKLITNSKLLVQNTIHTKNSGFWGFKEIKYSNVTDLEEYLNYLKLLFGNVCFIFNTRNLQEVIKSGWWANRDPEIITAKLSQLESRFKNYAAKHKRYCFEINYDDVCNKNDNFKQLYSFLGVAYDANRIKDSLEKKHSFANSKLLDNTFLSYWVDREYFTTTTF